MSSSIITPTFHRTEQLPEFFETYASGSIPSLKRIIILWNNAEPVPQDLQQLMSAYPVEVIIEMRASTSKNERFHIDEYIRTAGILAIDDDMIFDPVDIEFGYQVWRDFGQGRRRMAGYISRETTPEGSYIVSDFTAYSMTLTKSAFIHVDWLRAWWKDDEQMKELRAYVESRMFGGLDYWLLGIQRCLLIYYFFLQQNYRWSFQI